MKWNYAYISFHFQAKKGGIKVISEAWQEKRWTWGQNRKCKRIQQETSLNMRNIINHDEQCIKLLHFMLPVGKSKNYCRSYEFCQIICPLNNKSKQANVCKIFEFHLFKVVINNSVSVMLKLTKFHGIKGNISFWLQHFSTDTWYSAVNQSNINLKALQIRRLETSSPKGNDRSPESNVPRSNLISKNI